MKYDMLYFRLLVASVFALYVITQLNRVSLSITWNHENKRHFWNLTDVEMA